MSSLDHPQTASCLEQVFLLDRDAGLLCRILGLYAARALDVSHVDYAYAAQDVMKLSVRVAADGETLPDRLASVRVLVAKAATLVGVMAAAEHEPGHRAAVRAERADAGREAVFD